MICIILSTYNGAKYLAAQLDSLLAQDRSDIAILVRDDGSSDSTHQVLRDYSSKYKSITIHQGLNVGAIASFFELLKLVPPEADYVAFCDQDDVWRSDKLSRALSVIAELPLHLPAMYCSRLEVVDEKLGHLFFSNIPARETGFNNALVGNIATGCSMLINRAAVNLIVSRLPDTSKVLMHDWWVYLAVSAAGNVKYDQEAKILYRQHGNNVVGLSRGFANFYGRVKRFIRKGNKLKVSDQALEFQKRFGDILSVTQSKLLDRFLFAAKNAGVWQRIKFALNADVYRQTKLDDAIFKILLIWPGA